MANKSIDDGKAAGGSSQSNAPQSETDEQKAARIAADNKAADEKAAKEQADAEALALAEAGFVKMIKGDEVLKVHPSCVNSHIGAGWKVFE